MSNSILLHGCIRKLPHVFTSGSKFFLQQCVTFSQFLQLCYNKMEPLQPHQRPIKCVKCFKYVYQILKSAWMHLKALINRFKLACQKVPYLHGSIRNRCQSAHFCWLDPCMFGTSLLHTTQNILNFLCILSFKMSNFCFGRIVVHVCRIFVRMSLNLSKCVQMSSNYAWMH